MDTCAAEAEAGQTSPPSGWREFCSLTWRFWAAETGTGPADHLVIITAEPDCLEHVASVVADMLGAGRRVGPVAVRLARSPEVLRRLHGMPHWTGRAVTLYLPDEREQLETARELDLILARQGVSGPPCLRGRPYGGESGLVFLAGERSSPSSDHTDPLKALFSGVLV